MVLHRERRERLVADALDGSVVEIDVCNFQTVRNRLRHDGEVVVLAGDFHMARRKILNGMVASVVSELEPRRLRSAREREQLMPEADAHDGKWVSG